MDPIFTGGGSLSVDPTDFGGNINYAHVHSISFGDAGRKSDIKSGQWLNSFVTWHMVPTSRPLVNPPSVPTEYVTIPNLDGVIDLTETLGEEHAVHYGMRTGSWEFVVLHELNNTSWHTVFDSLMTNLHGKELRVALSDDPSWYYQGRIFVNQWRSDPHHSIVVLNYELDPWKYTFDTTGDHDWQFDDVIERKETKILYARFVVDGSKFRDFVYTGSDNQRPIFYTEQTGIRAQVYNAINEKIRGKITDLTPGYNRYEGLQLRNGHNEFKFTGNGVVTIYANLGASL